MISGSISARLAFMEMILNAKEGQTFVIVKGGQPRKITVSHDCKNSTPINGIWVDEYTQDYEHRTKILIIGTCHDVIRRLINGYVNERGYPLSLFVVVGNDLDKCRGYRDQAYIDIGYFDNDWLSNPANKRRERILQEMLINRHIEYDLDLKVVKK